MQELYNNYFNIINDQIWKVAIYARLSREDEKDDKYRVQSESIENQIKYLKSIVSTKGWILVDIYKDDGYTGTNFDVGNGITLASNGNRDGMILKYDSNKSALWELDTKIKRQIIK